MFNLIRISAGHRTVVMTDTRKKVNKRLKTLRKSHRYSKWNGERSKCQFVIESTDGDSEKFKKKPRRW